MQHSGVQFYNPEAAGSTTSSSVKQLLNLLSLLAVEIPTEGSSLNKNSDATFRRTRRGWLKYVGMKINLFCVCLNKTRVTGNEFILIQAKNEQNFRNRF